MTILAEHIFEETTSSPRIVNLITYISARWDMTPPKAEEIGGFQWVSTEGKYQGTLPKRMAKWATNHRHGALFSEHDISILGSQMKDAVCEKGFKITLTDNLLWDAGDFNDSMSCFWKSASVAHDVLVREKAWAMQVWEQDEWAENEWVGVGRCWVYELKKHDSVYGEKFEPGRYAMFNGYGKSLDWFASFIHLLMPNIAHIHNISMDAAGALYINDGKGILLNGSDETSGVYIQCANDTMHCDECDNWFYEEMFTNYKGEDSMCKECAAKKEREDQDEWAQEEAERLEREREAEDEQALFWQVDEVEEDSHG